MRHCSAAGAGNTHWYLVMSMKPSLTKMMGLSCRAGSVMQNISPRS
jgi:hypothetical protein